MIDQSEVQSITLWNQTNLSHRGIIFFSISTLMNDVQYLYNQSNNSPARRRVWPHNTIQSICQHKTLIVVSIFVTFSAKTIPFSTFGISRNSYHFETLKPLQFSCAVFWSRQIYTIIRVVTVYGVIFTLVYFHEFKN